MQAERAICDKAEVYSWHHAYARVKLPVLPSARGVPERESAREGEGEGEEEGEGEGEWYFKSCRRGWRYCHSACERSGKNFQDFEGCTLKTNARL